MDCGPTCLRMVAKYYGRHYNSAGLRQVTGFSKAGVSMLGLSEAAEKIGLRTRGVKLTFGKLIHSAQLPCILHWNRKHFVVMLPFTRWQSQDKIRVADPSKGIITYSRKEFEEYWYSSVNKDNAPTGTALLLDPTPQFYEAVGEKENKLSWHLVLKYFRQSRWQVVQVIVALLISSIFQVILPFMMQSIIDVGINTRDIGYITVILIAQLMLIFSRTIVDFIRTRLLLNISVIVNLSILSDFWIKLTRLPLSYFDRHQTGDTLQRIGDNKQIQNFLTGSALGTLFSMFNFVVFSFVLLSYSVPLFLVFLAGSVLYFLWIRLFLRIRRKLNYQVFHVSASENNAKLQLVQGMQEIRLNNAEQLKRWEWENIQTSIFKLNFKSLTYNQLQQAGALLISQGKDVVITFMAAKLVMEGSLTLGEMLAVQYIIGQLSGPIGQLVGFMQAAQDAKISMERLNEIHQLEDEEDSEKTYIDQLPTDKSLGFENFSFTYPGPGNDPVLSNVSLRIPQGKVTAIVGVSGSGKTTLLKLLLKFYDVYAGEIKVGETNFKYISPSFWRRQCGSVMQDGFIFNDTMARNVCVGDEEIDYQRLIESCRTANILSFIESLPNGFQTKLGSEGVGISQGQKQRLLIARAIYKDPHYLFFDEATNSLDANNEKEIIENLQQFFDGKTVIVVAHRLSTVMNADKIIVLHKGMIIEEGTHTELSLLGGKYYELVKNQLELGK